MKALHPTQQALLQLLENNMAAPLTIRELQEELELSSTSLVVHHMRQLEKRGYLYRNPFNPTDYRLLKSTEQDIVYLNLYGMAQCGPDGLLLSGDPVDRIPVSKKLFSFSPEEAFLLSARGDSMEPLIKEGDLIIAKKETNPRDGSIVVCINQGECLVKRFRRDSRQHILLESENSIKYGPFVASDDFRIEGEVKGVLSLV